MEQKEFKSYTVTLVVQFPAYSERDGIEFNVEAATSKSDAIKQARRMAEAAGYDRTSGRKTFTATVCA
jgi:hypothetical protein